MKIFVCTSNYVTGTLKFKYNSHQRKAFNEYIAALSGHVMNI